MRLVFLEFSISCSLALATITNSAHQPSAYSQPSHVSSPSTKQCTQPSWLDVRQLDPAFQKGLGRMSVLKGDPHFEEIFTPSIFESMLHDFRCESQVNFVFQFDHHNTALMYDGTITKLAFDADAFTISNMDTVENDDKEIHFTGSFRNFKVNCCFHTNTFHCKITQIFAV
jgi:hypothetical protein